MKFKQLYSVFFKSISRSLGGKIQYLEYVVFCFEQNIKFNHPRAIIPIHPWAGCNRHAVNVNYTAIHSFCSVVYMQLHPTSGENTMDLKKK